MEMSISGAGASGASQIWSSASAPMAPAQKMSNLFDQIDTSGSGAISQSQFTKAFQTMAPPASFQSVGADAVWKKLDPNGTGSVSKQDFVSSMTTIMKQLHGHHHRNQSSAAGAQSLAQNTSALNALGNSGASANTSAAVSDGAGVNLNTQA
jgi:hypothetical protein